MAKVTGPLMSLDASGGYGGALVFGKWKGRNTVRQLVTPSNPKTSGQMQARNLMTIASAVAAWMNRSSQKQGTATKTDEELFRAAAPSGQAWNGYLGSVMIGTAQANFNEAQTAYTAAAGAAAWDTAAAALVPPISAVTLKPVGTAPAQTVSGGQLFFHAVYAKFKAGIITAAPTATPPTYA